MQQNIVTDERISLLLIRTTCNYTNYGVIATFTLHNSLLHIHARPHLVM
jgi:hypothetical protein